MKSAARYDLQLAEVRALVEDVDGQLREGLEQIKLIRRSQRELKRAGRRRRRKTRGGERAGDEPLLAFVHIPKTAGKTVTTMLVGAYSKPGVRSAGNYLRGPEKTRRKVGMERKTRGRVIVGHVPYGLFRESLPADTRYMTFLREPTERVLSHYWRHLHRDPSRPPTPNPRKVRTETLEQALVEHRLPAVNNLMTRFLCGSAALDGTLTASAVDAAKRNLSEFAFVGLQERFEESIVLLQRTLGTGFVAYENHHVASQRPAVTERERDLIAECNQLDTELYEFGRGLFDQALADAPPGFHAEVEALRKLRSVDRDAPQ